MEVDWRPKFLENKQVDSGAHQQDALYAYPCSIIEFPTLTLS